jgi:diaminopimelate epimerase
VSRGSAGIMDSLPFSKMHGIGNDFVVIDCRTRPLPLDAAAIAQLGDRHTGVGFDQLLTIEPARDAGCAFRYGIYNRDGSEAAQCGNGVRCVAAWLRRAGALAEGLTRLESPSGPVTVEMLRDGRVRVDMGVPQFAPAAIPLREPASAVTYLRRLASDEVEFGAVSMGNPHAVIEVADTVTASVASWGPQLETHADFPDRANIGFAQVISPREIRLRVWERGVGETQACGSGACAAVVTLARRGRVGAEVDVYLPGGLLQIAWAGPEQPVWMTGPAAFVFEGNYHV